MMECLSCSYFLEAELHLQQLALCVLVQRHQVMQQLKAENCTWTSKRNKSCVGKNLTWNLQIIFQSLQELLLFSVEMYEDSCEITDGDMGPCLHPEGTQPGCTTGTVPEQGLAKLQQQLAGKGVRRTTETAQEEEEGKSAKKSCYDPT